MGGRALAQLLRCLLLGTSPALRRLGTHRAASAASAARGRVGPGAALLPGLWPVRCGGTGRCVCFSRRVAGWRGTASPCAGLVLTLLSLS